MFGFKSAVAEFFDINVGLSRTMAYEERHGVFAMMVDDKQELIGFIVDNPKLLKRPNHMVVQKLFNDVVKMGFDPIGVTIEQCGVCREYYPASDFSLQA